MDFTCPIVNGVMDYSQLDQFVIDYWENVDCEKEEDAKKKESNLKREEGVKFKKDEAEKRSSELSDLDELSQAIESIAGFPTKEIYSLLRSRFRIELERKDFHSSAMTLLQSQAIAFRFQALNQYNKRIMEKKKSSSTDENCMDEMLRTILHFRPPAEEKLELENGIKDLPTNWRIVQISVHPSFRQSLRFKSTPLDEAYTKANFGLCLVCVDCGSDEVDAVTVHEVQAVDSGDNPTIIYEFQDILEKHRRLYKAERSESRQGLKDMKETIDDRMTSVMDTIENKWLGPFKSLLFGRPIDENRVMSLEKKVGALIAKYFTRDSSLKQSGRKKFLTRILDLSDKMYLRQIEKGLTQIYGDGDRSELENFLKDFEKCKMSLEEENWSTLRHPTILILDKEIQGLPWEALSCFQAPTNQAFTRVPSLSFLQVLYATHSDKRRKAEVVRNDRIFYVLNPDKNLTKTQERLEPEFQKMSLAQGLVGVQPSLQQMQSVLSDWDAYMYCGHGSNLKNVPLQEIEKLHIQAVPLLFGCSSGRVERLGRQLDPLGTVSHYLIATAPRLLGFLWAITDRDVDTWTLLFLEHWIGNGPGPHESQFIQAVANLRGKFQRLINSAATVVYGLPDIS